MTGHPPDADPVLRLESVGRRFSGGVTALDGVSLTIRRGELLGIVGRSGSGKSTLLNLMGTLDRPTTGRVEIAGTDVSTLTDRQLSAVRGRWLGFVFQQFHLLDGLTAVENVAVGLLYAGGARRKRRHRAHEALERVGLEHRAGHQPTQLSGGERQRVAIARALVHGPALILADEPTGALDTTTGAGVMSLLRSLNQDGATIAVITHDQDIARALPRRIRISDGRILDDTRNGAAHEHH